MGKLIPKARVEVLHNAGHLPWLDEPERVAELIINFLKQ
jgi:pimeloyl-ACP methyl ester carboxylesterase